MLELTSEITRPPSGAAPFRVTVPVVDCDPVTGFGDAETVAKEAGVSVRRAETSVVPVVPALMVAATFEATPDVDTVNVAVVMPATTLTVAGTVADGLAEVKLTRSPPAGAAKPTDTVPVAGFPPTTLGDPNETEVTAGGNTV